jgi:Protein of unknown function (DUF2958)
MAKLSLNQLAGFPNIQIIDVPMPAPPKDYEFSTFQKGPAYRYIRPSDKILPIGATAEMHDDKIFATIKLFGGSSFTWYLAEYDPKTREAFGIADLGYGPELGYIHMPELVAMRFKPFGLPAERDLHWKPTTLADILAGKLP